MSSHGIKTDASVDSLDLTILDKLLANSRITFKELAEATHSDQRTIASRYQRLVKLGIIQSVTVQIDWSKIGLKTIAIIGTTTPAGEADRKKLLAFIEKECRVLEAFSTIGSHEYVMRVVDRDIAVLRNEVTTPLEPLTSGLDTSVAVER